MAITLFEKTYDDESLYDLDRDIFEAMSDLYSPLAKNIPKDEHGFRRGSFKVKIEWSEE
jgi:hypothetical protein